MTNLLDDGLAVFCPVGLRDRAPDGVLDSQASRVKLHPHLLLVLRGPDQYPFSDWAMPADRQDQLQSFLFFVSGIEIAAGAGNALHGLPKFRELLHLVSSVG